MGYGDQIFRRSSGIYVFRAVIPGALRARLSKTEIHCSTGRCERRGALLIAHRLGALFKQFFDECIKLDQLKAASSAPLFIGKGHLPLVEAAEAVGMPAANLARLIVNRDRSLWCIANGWAGYEVRDIQQLDREDGEYTWATVESYGEAVSVQGLTQLIDSDVLVASLSSASAASPYRVVSGRHVGYLFIQPRSVQLTLNDLWVQQADVEKLRLAYLSAQAQAIAAVQKSELARQPTTTSVAIQTPSTCSATTTPAASPSISTNATTSEFLIQRFIAEHSTPQLGSARAAWKADEATRNTQKLRCFHELMGNPALSLLSKVDTAESLIREYQRKLVQMPTGPSLRLARAATQDAAAGELIKWAAANKAKRMSAKTAMDYLSKLSECLNWGVDRGYISRNPVKTIVSAIPRSTSDSLRPNQQRPSLTSEDLKQVFGAVWFATGRAKRTGRGRPTLHFRPFYYWIPLLAIHTGGRANELAQLYLDDVKTSEQGVPYIKFQVTRPDQLVVDEDDELDPEGSGSPGRRATSPDKSLKTVNSNREVPLHSVLLDAGFMRYVDRLRSEGYVRLFPELRFDATKGYGLEARKWFNERFLGKELDLVRDGTKTLHSLRHNFATALNDQTPRSRMKSQLLGHTRGATLGDVRYTDDMAVDALVHIINDCKFDMPPVQAFDIDEGIAAIRQALRLKAVNL